MPYRIRGPKGGVVVRSAPVARITKSLPALIRRFKKITIDTAAKAKKKPVPKKPDQTQIRARIVEFCRWGIANEPQIHYTQFRPMERLNSPVQLRKLPRSCDCSEFATDAYAYAGAPDPNGQSYNGTGYTRTLLSHCRHISKAEAKAGDLVVFGPGSGHHVVVLLEDGSANGGNPMTCSHGQEKGPLEIRLYEEAAAQPSPITYLTCLD